MKMYPNQDTFKFMQGHVIMNQPMRNCGCITIVIDTPIHSGMEMS